jgi:hypothetical protein
MDFQALIPSIVADARQWVESQRNRYRPVARGLTETEWVELERFFTPVYLDLARITWGPVVEDPPFYPELQSLGLHFPFSAANGITYVDTIFLAESRGFHDPPPLPLLFHELVHVVQFSILGVDRFLSRYVQGYFEHGQVYEANPLEAHAIELQGRYVSGPTIGFSVGAHVQRMSQAY